MNKKLMIGSFALLAFLSSCGNKQTGANAPEQIKAYSVETVSSQNVELKSIYPATLKGQEDIDIKPRIDGFIEKVFVDEGSIVHRGQPLFKINSPASVQNVQNARASYNTAKLDVDRIRPLAEKGIYSKVKLSTYENALASAKAALDEAKAMAGWTTVTSPVNGIVGTLNYRQGSLVNNTTVLTSVANTTNIIAYFSINEKELLTLLKDLKGNTQAEKIRNMPRVQLLLSDGSEYEETGRIETISGVVDATSGSVNFRASFPNKHGLLRSGSSGKVVIPQPVSNALVIPQKATFSQQDKVLVFKVVGDSVVQKTITVKATPDGQSYVVLDGLASGEKIVTDGVATLKSGQKIKVKSLK
ncbi:MAG: efflux transporter, family, subunit [Bacteroidetes bacterium]|nr:efflux transporter, family, subunit [Bacteroidota bacterium]